VRLGPQFRFPARVVHEHEILAGKIGLRLDESVPADPESGAETASDSRGRKAKRRRRRSIACASFETAEPPLIREVGDPFPHRMTIEARSRSLGEEGKQGRLKLPCASMTRSYSFARISAIVLEMEPCVSALPNAPRHSR